MRKSLLSVDARPQWAIGADVAIDFLRNSVYGKASIANSLTDTHSTDIYASDSDGRLLPFVANKLVRTNLGLQMVPTRTNLALRSQEFDNASWVKGAVTATSNQALAPDGSLTADLILPSIANTNHKIEQTIASTAASYSVSFYVKPVGVYQKVSIREDAATGSYASFFLDGAGSVIASGGTGVGSITAFGNGWYHVTMVYTASATNHRPTLYLLDNAYTNVSPNLYAWAGDGVTGFYVWQGQYELGAFASPPIPTTTTSATVNGNQQVLSGLGTQLATGVAGLIQMNIMSPTIAGTPPRIFDINNGNTNENINLYINTATQLRMDMTAGGAAQGPVDLTTGTMPIGLATIAFTAAANYIRFGVVGIGLSSLDTAATYPSGIHTFGIAGRGYETTRNNYSYTRKLALDFLTPNDDPATKFNEWYAKAQRV